VEQFERIRRDQREEGLSVRALAVKHRVHRRTVRQALASAVPPPRKVPEREAPALGPYRDIVRGWLRDDLAVPRKQRHTARRVWQRLVDEHGAEVAESTVRAFVAEVRAELSDDTGSVTVPQLHDPGGEAEVDFGEFSAWVDGTLVKLWMFCMRLSASGRAFHVAFANQAQEAFLEGHRLAFEAFGGVVARVRYDNLKPAVVKVLFGRDRVEHERFVALRSHYGFDSFYCAPGIEGAHEKGGVEGEVGRFRRRHLVPVPVVADLAELNELIAAGDRADDDRRVARRAETVGEAFAVEADYLRALPAEAFGCFAELSAKVDTKARVCVRQSWYSVPARLARRRVTVRLHASYLEVLDGGRVVACHARSLHKGTETLVLDHYLEVLVRKPGALAGSVVLAQARAAGVFSQAHERFWAEARRRVGDGAGTRALCKVLLLHRNLPTDVVTAGIDAALAASSVDPEVVAIEARAAGDRRRQPAGAVIPISQARGAERPMPALGGYDDLLAAGGHQ
jgi:transposase/acyl-coenzyme A thioesterase PaaI-like protein